MLKVDDLVDYTCEDRLACFYDYNGDKVVLVATVNFYKKKIVYTVCKYEECGKSWEYSFTNLDDAVDCYNKNEV